MTTMDQKDNVHTLTVINLQWLMGNSDSEIAGININVYLVFEIGAMLDFVENARCKPLLIKPSLKIYHFY